MKTNSFNGLSAVGFHKITYYEWGAADAPVVLCVHGLTRNGRDFDALAEALAAKGKRVISPDIVGRGQSDWLANPALYGYPQYCADMAALIARLGVTTLDWVGTSMGGLIGMTLAAQAHTPIRKLVMNDVGPFIPKASLERLAVYVGTDPHFATLQELENYLRKIHSTFGDLTDADWQHMAQHSHRILPDGQFALAYDPNIAMAFKGMQVQDVNLWPFYDMVKAQTLVIHGAQSDLLLPETAAEMTQRGPKATLVEIPNAGHAPALLDAQQISIISNFLF